MSRIRSMLLAAIAVPALLAGCTSDDSDSSSDTTAAGGATTASSGGGATTAAGGAGTTAGGSATTASGGGGASAGAGESLEDIIAAGSIRCGSRDDLPGFSVLDPSGEHVGFDSDFCRVIATAIFGDADAAEFVDVETADRLTALQSGEIDVLVRNTTWTATRDGTEGLTFLQPNFYDGQGMMVAADSGVDTLEDLAGGVVCVAGGTTTEGNVATEFARLELDPPEVLSFESTDLLQEAFQQGRCDGWSSDTSQLTGLRSSYPDGPDSLVILPEIFSKEPLAPAVREADVALAQAVQWAVFATIQAEELGITSENVDEMRDTSTNPNVQRFLGVAVDGATLDPGLGLPVDFNYQIVKQVGNYGEIFEEHLAPLGLERGVNALWTDGGLLYSPPYR